MEYTIIRLNGKQYIVNKGSLMKLDRVTTETVVEVLMHGDDSDAVVGTPVIEGFGVKFEILEDKKDKKISVRRYKSKSRYRKEKGHRQPISIVKVIDFGKDIKTGFVIAEPRVAKTSEVTTEKDVSTKEIKKSAVKVEDSKVESKPATKKAASVKKPAKDVAESKVTKKKEK